MGTETAAEINKPALFKMLGYTPHAGQIPVHRSKAKRRILACGVRFGKSRCAAMEALAAALVPRKFTMGWIVAPSYDLAQKVFREVLAIATEHLPDRIITIKDSEHWIALRNLGGGRSEIRCKSADNPVSLLGEGLHFVIVDEAAQMKPQIWQNFISQRLVDKDGWALLISTPKGRGWFYEMYRLGQDRGDPNYESWNQPSWTNPHLNKALIDAERERLPERVFRTEYGGEFIEGAGQVFRYVREAATGELKRPEWNTEYFVGADLAKINDYTVVVVMNRKREVVFFDRFHRIDWGLQIARIKGIVKSYNDARLYVDSTGKGEPVYEALYKEGIDVKGYEFTAKSKAAIVDELSMMFEQRVITIPKPEIWPAAIEELEAFAYSTTDAGNTRTGAPSGMHDDIVVALGLAAWWVRISRPPFNPEPERMRQLFG